MADDILGSLKDAFGVEDEGPDPSSLTGLLEYTEGWLEDQDNRPSEVVHYFETMKNNVVGAHMQRKHELAGGKFDPQFVALVEKNLADMVSIEKALDNFIEVAIEDGRDECFEALGELEEALDTVKQSSAAIGAFLDAGPKTCLACGSIGEEDTCTVCGGERLRLDTNPNNQTEDERSVRVTDEVLAVYESLAAVNKGEAPLSTLVTELQSLEFTFLESEAIAEQALVNEAATDRMKTICEQMLISIRATLDGIEQMHGVVESRQQVDLFLGWKKILKHSVETAELLVKMNTAAEEMV